MDDKKLLSEKEILSRLHEIVPSWPNWIRKALEEDYLLNKESKMSEIKVTLEQVQSFIKDIQFSKMGKKTTVGIATLQNGFEIVESSSCVDPDNYDQSIGEKYVRERIEKKVWELLGFNLACISYVEESPSHATDAII